MPIAQLYPQFLSKSISWRRHDWIGTKNWDIQGRKPFGDSKIHPWPLKLHGRLWRNSSLVGFLAPAELEPLSPLLCHPSAVALAIFRSHFFDVASTTILSSNMPPHTVFVLHGNQHMSTKYYICNVQHLPWLNTCHAIILHLFGTVFLFYHGMVRDERFGNCLVADLHETYIGILRPRLSLADLIRSTAGIIMKWARMRIL